MPGAQQAEEVAVEGCIQQPVGLINRQYHRPSERSQDDILHHRRQSILRPQRQLPEAFYLTRVQPQPAQDVSAQISQKSVGVRQVIAIDALQV